MATVADLKAKLDALEALLRPAPPVPLGATNLRTNVFYPGVDGFANAMNAANWGDEIVLNPGVYGAALSVGVGLVPMEVQVNA